jgi:uncharacterized integral membrane protein
MQVFYWLIFLMAIGMAIFAVQNSNVPLITIKFLIWRLETSLAYTILGSMGVGIFIALFFCVPRMIRSSLRSKDLKKQIENLETALHGPPPPGQGRDTTGGM